MKLCLVTFNESFKDDFEGVRESALEIDRPVDARRIAVVMRLRMEPFAGDGEEVLEDVDAALFGGEDIAGMAIRWIQRGKVGRMGGRAP